MQLIFTIKHAGHWRKFREALQLDDFIKHTKFAKNTNINFTTETGQNIGTLPIAKYLKLEKKNKQATNSKTNILNTIIN